MRFGYLAFEHSDVEIMMMLCLSVFFADFEKYIINHVSPDVGNDHTNMTAPLPVCSAKLSMFGPS